MKIVLATDGSAHAQAAVDLVKRLPLTQANVTALSVGHVEAPFVLGPAEWLTSEANIANWYEFAREEEEKAALNRAKVAAEQLLRSGWQVEAVALRGHAAEQTLQVAQDKQADLIVLGSRGLGSFQAWLLGSVSQGVVASASCSVCVVRTHGGERTQELASLRVLLATDGSDDAQAATELLARLRFGAEGDLAVVTVVPEPIAIPAGSAIDPGLALRTSAEQTSAAQAYVEGVAESLKTSFESVESFVRQGDAPHQILDAAREWNADLIVLGQQGRAGIDSLITGSVSQKVAAHAECSVLVAKRR